MKIEFSDTALRDLIAIRDYISHDSPAAAERTLIRIQQSVRHLATFPELGRPWFDTGTRALSIPGLPYRVHYEITGQTVYVLTVRHTRRTLPDV